MQITNISRKAHIDELLKSLRRFTYENLVTTFPISNSLLIIIVHSNHQLAEATGGVYKDFKHIRNNFITYFYKTFYVNVYKLHDTDTTNNNSDNYV